MRKTFNIYCDESCHIENDHKDYMILGYVKVPYNQVKIHTEKIKTLKRKHNFFVEIKWSKVSKSKSAFYNDLIDYFFSSDICYRAVVIKKAKIDNDGYGQDFDTFYYKMYYQLLNHQQDMSASYNIYLDIKDTLGAYKVNKLKEILQNKYSVIRTLQNIRSHESLMLQLSDLLSGAINYNLNNKEKKVIAKKNIIDRIEKQANLPLTQTTYLSEEKLNLFFIELQ